MTETDGLFCDPHFHAAIREMEALGLRVTPIPHAGSAPYGVLAGSGSRRFLLPIRPRAVCAGSLALIQPMRVGPRALNRIFAWASRLGLSPTLLRNRVHVAGANRLARVFGPGGVHSAFLTGTAGPHRKLVVQCMDKDGGIKGYAKVSHAFAVHALLANEAAVLEELQALGLRSAVVPRVLLHEVRDGTAVMATDTAQPLRRLHPFSLQAVHLLFLDELTARTASWARSGDVLLRAWNALVLDLAERLSAGWQTRFQRALQLLESKSELIASQGLAHGDFTPVNSFPSRNGLFVFDWEYAGDSYPSDFDLIRFLDAAAQARLVHPEGRVAAIQYRLCELGRSEEAARARLVAYLCVYALRGACGQPRHGGKSLQWASERRDAAMLDALLASVRRDGGPGLGTLHSRRGITSPATLHPPSRVHEACGQTAPA